MREVIDAMNPTSADVHTRIPHSAPSGFISALLELDDPSNAT
jgi:hypothetical protein